MTDETAAERVDAAGEAGQTEQIVETPPQTGPVVSVESRFLFVDVAALRAKQLRRGALPRLPNHGEGLSPKKPERIAMEEVRRGLVRPVMPEGEPHPTGSNP